MKEDQVYYCAICLLRVALLVIISGTCLWIIQSNYLNLFLCIESLIQPPPRHYQKRRHIAPLWKLSGTIIRRFPFENVTIIVSIYHCRLYLVCLLIIFHFYYYPFLGFFWLFLIFLYFYIFLNRESLCTFYFFPLFENYFEYYTTKNAVHISDTHFL